MTDFWSFLLQTLTASGAAALLLLLKAIFRDKMSPRWQFAVWGVLGLVLLLPAGRGGRYTLLNWPFLVELLRSRLTGEYGALAHVAAPIPLPTLTVPRTAADWLFALYFLGVAFFLLRYLISYIRLRLALKKGRPAQAEWVRAAAERYGLQSCPAVEVEGLPSAFICGVLRPVLALPAGTETEEKVLLHELLHLKYRDAAWGLVICFFRCLHWCNPLLWYCADRAGNDLESLCDQRVLERLEGEDRRDYGRILLSMADEKYARAPGTSSMANGGKNIRRRIEAIARFKRYPAGMGLVSVCMLLVLAAPLAAGVQAAAIPEYLSGTTARLVYGRTTPCTTYAGAFDTYAKAVLAWDAGYRAMCAPLSDQNELAQGSIPGTWAWPEISRKDLVDRSDGYQIYNLTQVGERAYEGLLALTLNHAPAGEEWSGLVAERWMLVQPLRAEKEGERWVIIPQGELTAVQGDVRVDGNLGLPAWEYEAPVGDFTLRFRWQSTSQVDSYGEPDWMGNSVFLSTPVPNGVFSSQSRLLMMAVYNGAPEERTKYHELGASYRPMEAGESRPELSPYRPVNGSWSNSDGEGWSWNSLDWDWSDEVILIGGQGSWEDSAEPPDAYAADFYVNGKKAAELTLRPVKGGMDFD